MGQHWYLVYHIISYHLISYHISYIIHHILCLSSHPYSFLDWYSLLDIYIYCSFWEINNSNNVTEGNCVIACSWNSNLASLKLGKLARRTRLGEADAFISHSWTDDPLAKWQLFCRSSDTANEIPKNNLSLNHCASFCLVQKHILRGRCWN